MARNLFVVMRLCSPVVLSYLDAGFERRCGRKDFWTGCLLATAAACCCPSRLELRPSWVLVLLNALEITVEETVPALEMCLPGQYDRPEKRLKNGSFSP